MRARTGFRRLAYLVVSLGASLAFAVAIVPFYEAGHRLALDLLLLGLLPYIVYGAFTGVVRGPALAVAGVLLLAIELGVRIPERYVSHDGFADGSVYWAPLAATFVLLPLVLGIGWWRAKRHGGGGAPP
jgi:hypothetical protein